MSAATHDPAGESRETIRALSVLGAFFFIVALGSYLVTISWSARSRATAPTLVVGRDFLNFWMYGRSAFTARSEPLLRFVAYHGALDALLGANYPGQNWSYPPSLFFVAAPFGLLGYLPALLIWTVFGVALFVAVARARIGDRRLLIALVAVARGRAVRDLGPELARHRRDAGDDLRLARSPADRWPAC